MRLERRDDPAFHRGVDRGNGRSHVERVLARPLPSTFLLCFIQNHIEQGLAGFLVFFRKNVCRDLDEVAFEFSLIPFVENAVQFGIVDSQATVQQVSMAPPS